MKCLTVLRKRIPNPVQSSIFQVLRRHIQAGLLFSTNLTWMNSAAADLWISTIPLLPGWIGSWACGFFTQVWAWVWWTLFFHLTWYVFYCFDLNYSQYHIRSRPYLSPSTWKTSSINMPSCCPADHDGSPKRSTHRIWPSDQLHSTGTIPSNLYSISSIALNFRMWWSSHHIAYMNQWPASIVFIQNGCLVTMHGSCRSVFLHYEGLCTDIR